MCEKKLSRRLSEDYKVVTKLIRGDYFLLGICSNRIVILFTK